MSAKEQLFSVYQKFYAQRHVLTEMPPLSMDLSTFTPETFDYATARSEVATLVSRLMGVRDIDKVELKNALDLIEKYYTSQPFWKNLILDYLSFTNKEEAEEAFNRVAKAKQRAETVLREIQQQEANEKATIQAYAEPVKAQKFAINAEKMMQNYLNMCRKDAKKAWEILTTNPGWFSPIITTDSSGNTVLTAEQAAEENKKIGKFLKGLSI